MKYLIAGLGNIGDEYENTRHNIGFKVLDFLVKESNTSFSLEKQANLAEIKFKGRKLLLIKPTTYMNLSGKAVSYWVQKEKILPENILVITDDLALPFGTLRMKSKGSDGGHNGLKSIQESLNTATYPRLRFGVGNDYHKGQQVNYVLGGWSSDEENLLNERISKAAQMVKAFCTIGIAQAMSQFNNK